MKKEKQVEKKEEKEMSFEEYLLKHLIIKDGKNKSIKIMLHKLVSIESSRNYLLVNVEGMEQMKVRGVLEDWKVRLMEPHFMVSHDSFLINVYHIVDFTSEGGGLMTLTGGVTAKVVEKNHAKINDILYKDALFVADIIKEKGKSKVTSNEKGK
jgi:DNA-binding LytR/AlgR family response regulator